ncbi:MAG: hypothetical protein CMG80_17275 [Marinobacter sp.]|nr:hypothetical protein [Marinobacter sp.]
MHPSLVQESTPIVKGNQNKVILNTKEICMRQLGFLGKLINQPSQTNIRTFTLTKNHVVPSQDLNSQQHKMLNKASEKLKVLEEPMLTKSKQQ